MKIVVCVKQVPGTARVPLDPVTHTIRREGTRSVLNPFDSYALEQAVQIAERTGAKTLALSMGIADTELLLRDAISRGIDGGMLLSDRAFAGADTLATAYTLSMGIRRAGGADLVLCGKMAVDGDTGQIGPELAEFLGMAHVTQVTKILAVTDKSVTVKRKAEGESQLLQVRLPALLTVVREGCVPRLPSIRGIRAGERARVPVLDANGLGVDTGRTGLAGSPTQVVRTFMPQRESEAVSLGGSAQEQSTALISLLQEVGTYA